MIQSALMYHPAHGEGAILESRIAGIGPAVRKFRSWNLRSPAPQVVNPDTAGAGALPPSFSSPAMQRLRKVLKAVDRRLAVAMACYVILAAVATIFLDGALRVLMWAFFAILALKTMHAPRMDK
ncbi:MAG: hypothetical protein HXY20_01000 [Acidobacteria bacterium]|nr:hypothetical protein [Acidobacteriota bacterium]